MKWLFLIFGFICFIIVIHTLITEKRFDEINALWMVVAISQYDIARLKERVV